MMNVFIKNRDGFVFDEATQTLMPYKFNGAIVNFNKGLVIHKCTVDGVNREYTSDFEMYLSEDDFKKRNQHRGIGWDLQEVVSQIYGCCLHNDVEAFTFINGEARLTDVSVVDFAYKGGTGWYAPNGERFYATPQRVYDFHDYKVKDENGDVRVVKSANSRLSLTDEQMAVVLDFERAFKKLRELNVQMYYDMEGESMKLVNGEHIERTLWGEHVDEMVDLRGMGYDFSFYPISYNSCDWDLAVKLKKS